MPLYLWMSKEQANYDADKNCAVNEAGPYKKNLGYVLGLDRANSRVYQYTDATTERNVIFKEKDMELVGVVTDPETLLIVSAWDGMTAEGKKYCIDEGLDVCLEEIQDAVANKGGFYKPVPVVVPPSGQPPVTTVDLKPVP